MRVSPFPGLRRYAKLQNSLRARATAATCRVRAPKANLRARINFLAARPSASAPRAFPDLKVVNGSGEKAADVSGLQSIMYQDQLNRLYQNAKPEAPPLPAALYRLRVESLKDICRSLHLRLAGRKSDLLDRIEHAWRCDNHGVRATIRNCLAPFMSPSEAAAVSSAPASSNNGSGGNKT